MEKDVHMWMCDRNGCGKSIASKEDGDMYEPDGWRYINKRLFCDRCSAQYDRLFESFCNGDPIHMNGTIKSGRRKNEKSHKA